MTRNKGEIDPEAGASQGAAGGAALPGWPASFVFPMEYGGVVAVVDDFYVRPAYRAAGHGSAALADVRRVCAGLGMRAMRVEVARDNTVARSVYGHAGFAEVDRLLMIPRLADPTYVA